MKIRKATWADAIQFIQWLFANKDKNHCDLGILQYPRLDVYVANTDDNTSAYLPVQTVAVLESFAPRPDSDAKERLEACVGMVRQVEKDAYEFGIREVMYLSSDPRTDEVAEKLGYQKIIAYRKKLQ